ncbi:hypothetical protein GCM10010329_30040 [Streptomyces spiroverticillatus]|uniref:DUF4232 domain-containing protein n=1 Tax=Streptomyces finlayi TaxID=67296 RepID=A0A918WW12_9ACTN|nr:DUF4232 domain-containing protein [Streptomyces finlayi]GHA05572.1 hypothetical protein GCM10010329_30040 [Streptomyces spiroverticillatus]GHC89414.1 hypothetical protein GCM10010334_22450 [Streptomyces finlayi]
MKSARITALTAISIAAALSLTACNGDDSGDNASPQGSSSSSSSSPSSDGASKPGSGSDDGKGSAGSGSGSTKAAPKPDGKVTFCKTADLAIDARYSAPDKQEGRIDITMINRGSTTCSATGFAGVDIKDTDNTSNPIERGRAEPRITTLKPGKAAVFNLAYTIDPTGKSLAHPVELQVTPPNETHTVYLKWPKGAGAIKGAYTDVQVYPTHTVE